MPTVVLQVGQCGNQVGGALWDTLQAQSTSSADPIADTEYFKHTLLGAKKARAILVDTEPKVVNTVLGQDKAGLFTRSRCYLGQSGRGNNWSFGYRQLAPKGPDPAQQPAGQRPVPVSRWNNSTQAEDPNQQEFHILENVFEGIRCEVEECDGAANFLLLHSLGGGSGSGMGSRILEHLREEYPLNYITAVSIAPRTSGDTPMQSINTVLALSFLQCYADAVLLFNNQDLLDAASKRDQLSSTNMADLNQLIAQRLLGCLWPLDSSDALRGTGRIRDMVTSVACDPCTKLLETWSVHMQPNTPVTGIWQESVRSLHTAAPKYSATNKRPITTAGALLLARGFPSAAVNDQSTSAAMRAYMKVLATHGSPMALTQASSLHMRCGAGSLCKEGGGRHGPSLTTVCNRSSTIELLDATVDRALGICQAGAYLHWYAKYGCPKEAIEEAALRMADVSACYRQLHLQREAPGHEAD